MIATTATASQGLAEVAPDPWASALETVLGPHGGTVTSELIGRSIEDRAIRAYRVRSAAAGDVRRPTVVVIAGLDARHIAGTRVAIGVLDEILKSPPAALERADLVVIPCVNPDGAQAWLAGGPRFDRPGNAAQRGTAREDDDRDRRVDEDAPQDLNGDGLITQMRVRRPRPGSVLGLTATDVAEQDDARLMRRADAARGETGEWAVLVEGRDQDGDGRIAEDAATGVDLDANFPHHWREFDGIAGPTPLSEPESRALAEWLLARPEVVAVLTFAPKDNLTGVPEGGKMDATGQSPISGGILDDDKPLYEWAHRTFKDTTGITGTGGVGAGGSSFDGSLSGWAYAQLGVASFVNPGWVRPDLGKPREPVETDPPTSDTTTPAERKYPDNEEGRWLALSDRRVAASEQAGFIDWKAFEHPELGPVEMGGWVPGFRLDAPAAEIELVAKEQAAFVAALLAAAPKLEVDPVRVERIGESAWKVSVSARNVGVMATRTVMGVRARRFPPTRWEIDVPAERLVAGRRSQGEARVEAGAGVSAEWVVIGQAGETVRVKLRSPECGDQELEAVLPAGADADGGRP